MAGLNRRAIVAGHLCLDLFPVFDDPPGEPSMLFSPGHLFAIGSTTVECGGVVANTGGALLRLGVDARLIGRIGDDGFGAEVQRTLEGHHRGATAGLRRITGEATSYTIVFSSPRFDRIFFHFSGANDRFTSADVRDVDLADRDLLHFGYPPAMSMMYENNGEELYRLLSRSKAAGLTTSLDLSYPQEGSKALRVNWRSLLERVLPFVDIFLPGIAELNLLLGSAGRRERAAAVEAGELREAASWAIEAGCAVCALKLGQDGLYVRTSDDRGRIAAMGRGAPTASQGWSGRELLEPCFAVAAAGTTGAGDVTVAGFLAGLLTGCTLDETTRIALAAGAASVEGVDAISRLPDRRELVKRVERGWERRRTRISLQE